MSLFECKCCGGNVEEISRGLGKCTSCRKMQSIPVSIDVEKVNRANRLRKRAIFDEAYELYSKIIKSNPEDSEAYWGLVLCRYGIEYVDDYNNVAVPTCHRTIEGSIFEDSDFIMACEKADDELKKYYQEQAKIIDDIQKKIISIADSEKPYDIFISYKSHNEDGKPTVDSKYAQKIFNVLERKGFRVFFAEESLKKFAGTEYEPHIYSALKSSKFMVLIGGKEEHFNSAWVRNEWSRYQAMIRSGEDKLLLLVYFDMDPYDLPMELSKLQAIDWKTSDAQDTLISCIENKLGGGIDEKREKETAKEVTATLEKINQDKARAKFENAKQLFMTQNTGSAKEILDELISEVPNHSEAYWYRLLIKLNTTEKEIINIQKDFSSEADFVSAMNTANENERNKYTKYLQMCRDNILLQKGYDEAHLNLTKRFLSLSEPGEPIMRYGQLYNQLCRVMSSGVYNSYEQLFNKCTPICVFSFTLVYLIIWALTQNIAVIIAGAAVIFTVLIVLFHNNKSLLKSLCKIKLITMAIGFLILKFDSSGGLSTCMLLLTILGVIVSVIAITVVGVKVAKIKNSRKKANELFDMFVEASHNLCGYFEERERQLAAEYMNKRLYEDTRLRVQPFDDVERMCQNNVDFYDKTVRNQLNESGVSRERDRLHNKR